MGPSGDRGYPVVGLLGGHGRAARAHPQPGHGAPPHQIRVNAVSPAVVASPIYEKFVPEDKIDETLHSFDSFQPLGRVGTTRELGNTITFLLSPATSRVTGAIWNVDGGVMA